MDNEESNPRKISRRKAIELMATWAGGALLAACGVKETFGAENAVTTNTTLTETFIPTLEATPTEEPTAVPTPEPTQKTELFPPNLTVVKVGIMIDGGIKEFGCAQQPQIISAYVATEGFTQFALPTNEKLWWLLIHNNSMLGKALSGSAPSEIEVTTGDGGKSEFGYTNSMAFETVNPTDPKSDQILVNPVTLGREIDLETGKENRFNASQTYSKLVGYDADGKRVVIIQTCIEKGGKESWGRRFHFFVEKGEGE